jgi:hypothetical protein
MTRPLCQPSPKTSNVVFTGHVTCIMSTEVMNFGVDFMERVVVPHDKKNHKTNFNVP